MLEGEESSKEPAIALAKLLATCFVIRGAQLSVVGKIDPKAVVNIHTTLLTWIGQYIATYEKNKNKKQRHIAAGFFKVLLPLLSSIESRDALKMWVPGPLAHNAAHNRFCFQKSAHGAGAGTGEGQDYPGIRGLGCSTCVREASRHRDVQRQRYSSFPSIVY